MAEEPNSQIDEALRRYADERRKTTPPPLHRATRSMLHAERRRIYGEAAPIGTPGRSWIRRFWPQLAFGAAICTLLAAGLLWINRSQMPVKLLSQAQPESPVPMQLPPSDVKKEIASRSYSAPRDLSDNPSRKSKEQSNPLPGNFDEKLPSRAEMAQKPSPPEAMSSFSSPTSSLAISLASASTALNAPKIEAVSADRAKDNTGPATPVPVFNLGTTAQPQSTEKARTAAPSNLAIARTDGIQPLEANLQGQRRELKAKTDAGITQIDALQSPSSSKHELKEKQEPQGRFEASPKSVANAYRPSGTLPLRKLQNLGGALRTFFVSITNTVPRLQSAAAPAPPILLSFQMEQVGDEVSFVDSDGSIYRGSLTRSAPAPADATDPNPRRDILEREAAPPLLENMQALPALSQAIVNFSVTGQNLSLGRSVVFTGTYVQSNLPMPSPAGPPVALRTGELAGEVPGKASARAGSFKSAAPLPALNGTAVIGGTNIIQIHAMPQK